MSTRIDPVEARIVDVVAVVQRRGDRLGHLPVGNRQPGHPRASCARGHHTIVAIAKPIGSAIIASVIGR